MYIYIATRYVAQVMNVLPVILHFASLSWWTSGTTTRKQSQMGSLDPLIIPLKSTSEN